MRFSSLVSLVVVSASLALGGCAADAEQTSGENTGDNEAALFGSARAHQTFDKATPPAAFAAEAARTRTTKLNGEAVGVGRTPLQVGGKAVVDPSLTADLIDGPSAGLDTAPRAELIDGVAANPIELVEVGPEFGAHLPSNQQLSRSGEAHEHTNTSGAKREP